MAYLEGKASNDELHANWCRDAQLTDTLSYRGADFGVALWVPVQLAIIRSVCFPHLQRTSLPSAMKIRSFFVFLYAFFLEFQ